VPGDLVGELPVPGMLEGVLEGVLGLLVGLEAELGTPALLGVPDCGLGIDGGEFVGGPLDD